MNEASPEVSVMHNYLDWIINLPWNKSKKKLLISMLYIKNLINLILAWMKLKLESVNI